MAEILLRSVLSCVGLFLFGPLQFVLGLVFPANGLPVLFFFLGGGQRAHALVGLLLSGGEGIGVGADVSAGSGIAGARRRRRWRWCRSTTTPALV